MPDASQVRSNAGAGAACIVIPCYNEERRFDAPAFERYLEATSGTKLVLVNDGSTDATLSILTRLATAHPDRVRVIDLSQNRGKAEAVRQGMLLALKDGECAYAGYWDADLATPLEAVQVFVDVLQRLPDVDVVFGARVALLGRRIERRAIRHYLGRVFATGASIVLSLPVYDSQCGAKLFRANELSRSLFASPFGSRWVFDVEIVARYVRERRGKIGIYELPLDHWKDIGESKVRPLDFVRAIGELFAIYRAYRLPGAWRNLLNLVTAPFVRYAGAGAVGTVVHYATLAAAVEIGHLAPAVATPIGATLGASVNYVLNYHFTFVSTRRHTQTLPRFLTVAALTIALSYGIVKGATERIGIHYLLAQLSATLVVLGVGFVLNKLWTFAASRGSKRAATLAALEETAGREPAKPDRERRRASAG